jgi:hypothetical protein
MSIHVISQGIQIAALNNFSLMRPTVYHAKRVDNVLPHFGAGKYSRSVWKTTRTSRTNTRLQQKFVSCCDSTKVRCALHSTPAFMFTCWLAKSSVAVLSNVRCTATRHRSSCKQLELPSKHGLFRVFFFKIPFNSRRWIWVKCINKSMNLKYVGSLVKL